MSINQSHHRQALDHVTTTHHSNKNHIHKPCSQQSLQNHGLNPLGLGVAEPLVLHDDVRVLVGLTFLAHKHDGRAHPEGHDHHEGGGEPAEDERVGRLAAEGFDDGVVVVAEGVARDVDELWVLAHEVRGVAAGTVTAAQRLCLIAV